MQYNYWLPIVLMATTASALPISAPEASATTGVTAATEAPEASSSSAELASSTISSSAQATITAAPDHEAEAHFDRMLEHFEKRGKYDVDENDIHEYFSSYNNGLISTAASQPFQTHAKRNIVDQLKAGIASQAYEHYQNNAPSSVNYKDAYLSCAKADLKQKIENAKCAIKSNYQAKVSSLADKKSNYKSNKQLKNDWKNLDKAYKDFAKTADPWAPKGSSSSNKGTSNKIGKGKRELQEQDAWVGIRLPFYSIVTFIFFFLVFFCLFEKPIIYLESIDIVR